MFCNKKSIENEFVYKIKQKNKKNKKKLKLKLKLNCFTNFPQVL